ncbi:unnamed protein product [Peniophora sp. CBMAI 1063]|nr:unnamed protein product [Peniophora sp. CBMAI 1063]
MSACLSCPVVVPVVLLSREERTKQGTPCSSQLPSYPDPHSLFAPQISKPHSARQMNTAHDDLLARFESVNTPHPDLLWLPWYPATTREGQDFVRWETQQIRTLVATIPEPTAPATEEQLKITRQRLAQCRKTRKSTVDDISPIFNTLPPHHRAKVSREYAHAFWQEKVFRCHLMRIYEFPPEIVVHVLQFLLDDNLDFYRTRLSAVCRQWRELVVKMPKLWQDIWLNDTAPHSVSASLIERAQSLPLTIRIGERRPTLRDPRSNAITPEEMDAQLDVVLPKLSQIRSLTVILRGWPATYTFLRRAYTCSAAPSQLEIFRLHRTSAGYADLGDLREETDGGRHLLLFRGRATRLHTLAMDGVHLDWSIPLSNLDSLDMRRMPLSAMPSWSRFAELTHLSPNLRELSFDGCAPLFSLIDADLPRQRVLLPNLRTFVMGGMSIPFLIRLPYLLDTPNLIELSLRNYQEDLDWTPVFRMLVGSYPQLRILQLNAIRVSPEPPTTGALTRFFMSVKNVELVRLINMHESFLNHFLEDGRYYLDPEMPPVMTDDMRRAIEAEHPEPIRMLPALKTIIYDGVLTQEISRFADSRRRLGLPLDRLYAHVAWYLTLRPEERRTLHQIPGFMTLAVALDVRASPEEQAIWRDVEGPNAVIRNSRI